MAPRRRKQTFSNQKKARGRSKTSSSVKSRPFHVLKSAPVTENFVNHGLHEIARQLPRLVRIPALIEDWEYLKDADGSLTLDLDAPIPNPSVNAAAANSGVPGVVNSDDTLSCHDPSYVELPYGTYLAHGYGSTATARMAGPGNYVSSCQQSINSNVLLEKVTRGTSKKLRGMLSSAIPTASISKNNSSKKKNFMSKDISNNTTSPIMARMANGFLKPQKKYFDTRLELAEFLDEFKISRPGFCCDKRCSFYHLGLGDFRTARRHIWMHCHEVVTRGKGKGTGVIYPPSERSNDPSSESDSSFNSKGHDSLQETSYDTHSSPPSCFAYNSWCQPETVYDNSLGVPTPPNSSVASNQPPSNWGEREGVLPGCILSTFYLMFRYKCLQCGDVCYIDNAKDHKKVCTLHPSQASAKKNVNPKLRSKKFKNQYHVMLKGSTKDNPSSSSSDEETNTDSSNGITQYHDSGSHDDDSENEGNLFSGASSTNVQDSSLVHNNQSHTNSGFGGFSSLFSLNSHHGVSGKNVEVLYVNHRKWSVNFRIGNKIHYEIACSNNHSLDTKTSAVLRSNSSRSTESSCSRRRQRNGTLADEHIYESDQGDNLRKKRHRGSKSIIGYADDEEKISRSVGHSNVLNNAVFPQSKYCTSSSGQSTDDEEDNNNDDSAADTDADDDYGDDSGEISSISITSTETDNNIGDNNEDEDDNEDSESVTFNEDVNDNDTSGSVADHEFSDDKDSSGITYSENDEEDYYDSHYQKAEESVDFFNERHGSTYTDEASKSGGQSKSHSFDISNGQESKKYGLTSDFEIQYIDSNIQNAERLTSTDCSLYNPEPFSYDFCINADSNHKNNLFSFGSFQLFGDSNSDNVDSDWNLDDYLDDFSKVCSTDLSSSQEVQVINQSAESVVGNYPDKSVDNSTIRMDSTIGTIMKCDKLESGVIPCDLPVKRAKGVFAADNSSAKASFEIPLSASYVEHVEIKPQNNGESKGQLRDMISNKPTYPLFERNKDKLLESNESLNAAAATDNANKSELATCDKNTSLKSVVTFYSFTNSSGDDLVFRSFDSTPSVRTSVSSSPTAITPESSIASPGIVSNNTSIPKSLTREHKPPHIMAPPEPMTNSRYLNSYTPNTASSFSKGVEGFPIANSIIPKNEVVTSGFVYQTPTEATNPFYKPINFITKHGMLSPLPSNGNASIMSTPSGHMAGNTITPITTVQNVPPWYCESTTTSNLFGGIVPVPLQLPTDSQFSIPYYHLPKQELLCHNDTLGCGGQLQSPAPIHRSNPIIKRDPESNPIN
ncbi:hypothetical protein DASC09_055170 [Saccharomycopsis crataegensis]|uniref:Uncharacterized protein n=1 Tax=Saccharomycopsis crataegensis TaxID=43959 RepID=A0AAV5QTD8_9ASCO|nr:hypothetical protein DASC09_055170 [Saccharomycopsis crataegensis]